MFSEIMIFTNGRSTTFPAIKYGAWLGASLRTSIRLVGLDEESSPARLDEETHPLEAVFAEAVDTFRKTGAEYSLEILQGPAEDVIPARVKERDALVMLGPLGRPPLKRLLSGRSFRYILAQVAAPILYVPQARLPLKRALVCLGGLGYEVTAENIALQIARAAQAEVTLMTVVPPIDFDYPEAKRVRENWENLLETDTLPGRNLRRGLEIARAAGLEASVKVRNGIVTEEIQAEVKDGNYDLLCMGSPFSATTLRQFYTPNVTAEIAEMDLAPVLTARYARENAEEKQNET